MRNLVLFFLLITLSYSCQKSIRAKGANTSDNQLLQDAHAFMLQPQHTSLGSAETTPRTIAAKSPDWNNAAVIALSHTRAVLVPIHYAKRFLLMTDPGGAKLYAIDQITHLLIYRDTAAKWQAELITALPDSNYVARQGNSFTGTILVERWTGGLIARYRYNENTTLIDDPRIIPSKSTTSLSFQVCNEIDGYNYSPEDPDNGVSWSETLGCTTYFLPVRAAQSEFLSAVDYADIGGGGGGTVPSPAANFQILSGHNPIVNIRDYNKCFTDDAASDHTYKVTVCVDQPAPGTREAWGFAGSSSSSSKASPFNVGHTFLIFTETYGNINITRNVGFYPTGIVTPWATSSQGQLNNNAGADYDISLTITVDNTQFFNILNYVSAGSNPGYMYDLNSNNCTTFALHALAEGGINLPSTIGVWPHGEGNDPGDLGEDIRSMSLSANMSRSTNEADHPNVGTCN